MLRIPLNDAGACSGASASRARLHRVLVCYSPSALIPQPKPVSSIVRIRFPARLTWLTIMASVPSSTTSSAGAAATMACSAGTYDIPTTDAACAVVAKPGNYSEILTKCCGAAPVTTYDNNCASYCLAEGQSTGNLVNCFTSNGVGYQDAFCNANVTATATAKASTSATGSSTATGASSSKGAAPAVAPPSHVSIAGMALLAMLFVSTVATQALV